MTETKRRADDFMESLEERGIEVSRPAANTVIADVNGRQIENATVSRLDDGRSKVVFTPATKDSRYVSPDDYERNQEYYDNREMELDNRRRR